MPLVSIFSLTYLSLLCAQFPSEIRPKRISSMVIDGGLQDTKKSGSSVFLGSAFHG